MACMRKIGRSCMLLWIKHTIIGDASASVVIECGSRFATEGNADCTQAERSIAIDEIDIVFQSHIEALDTSRDVGR